MLIHKEAFFQCFIERFAISCGECVTQCYRWRLRHLLWRSAWKETRPSLEQSLAGGLVSLTAETCTFRNRNCNIKAESDTLHADTTGRSFLSVPGISSHIAVFPVMLLETVWRSMGPAATSKPNWGSHTTQLCPLCDYWKMKEAVRKWKSTGRKIEASLKIVLQAFKQLTRLFIQHFLHF